MAPRAKRATAKYDAMAALERLADNFRWVWDRPTQRVFQTVDAETWNQTHDPREVLRRAPRERLDALAADPAFVEHVRAAENDLTAYLADAPAQPLVAYFCMEHGIAPNLRTYAGGLGMLA